MSYVYRHIRLDQNVPFYIGIGTGKYYKRASSKSRRSNYWKAVVNKAGYKVEIMVDNLSYEEAKVKEIEFISLYGRHDLNNGTLANLTDGGDGNVGYIYSEKSKKQMSESAKKKILKYGHPMQGKTRSEEANRKQSDSMMGKYVGGKNGMYGKTHTKESINKIKEKIKLFHQSEKGRVYREQKKHQSQQWMLKRPKKEGCSSKYKGVIWDKNRNKWMAGIKKNQKKINLGRFDSEENAALAYNEKAFKLFGNLITLNIIKQ